MTVQQKVEKIDKELPIILESVNVQLESKGAPTAETFSKIPDCIEEIPKGIDASDADTPPEDVIEGKIYYNRDGRQEGKMPIRASGFNIIPTTDTIILPSGYRSDDIWVVGETNLLPENIKKNVEIFRVVGTYEGEGGGTTNTFYNDYWNTLMPTEDSLKASTLANAKIVNKKVFRPNKNIVVKYDEVFRDMNDTRYGLVDVPALCEELGIIIDYSQNTNFTYTHRSNTLFERLGIVDCSNATKINGCFQLMSNLRTIDKWIVAEGKVTDNGRNLFNGSTALVNLTVEGTIDFNINLQESKDLSDESGISVLLALKDFAGTGNEFAHSAIFSTETWERIEASEQRPPNGNSWQEYATNKKWATT